MSKELAYDVDLAYVHDQGYGGFARGSAPGLPGHLRRAGIDGGLVVDLGCGSGIWAGDLVHAGYRVVGVDLSAAMIQIARQRVPDAQFHVESFLRFPVPPCRAVTALGKVFNYLFDAGTSLWSLRTVCENVFSALSPGGLLIFDVAGPGRCRERRQAFTEGEDWTCLVEYRHDEPTQRLVRRIVTFRKVGDAYRRSEEVHRQQLFEQHSLVSTLEGIGFAVQVVRGHGDYRLAEGVCGFVAQRPS